MAVAESATNIQDISSIGERIRAARKKISLNQTALAARVGVSQPAVANWESGVHDPRRLMLAKLAEALTVSPEWLASGARSPTERDKHPAAAYLRRPVHHTPLISFADAARLLDEPGFDPHSVAEDYLPVTSGSENIFALFVTDNAVNLAFPTNTLVVIDYADRRPSDGAFCLAEHAGPPILRRWREGPERLEPFSSDPGYDTIAITNSIRIIGCATVSIRFH